MLSKISQSFQWSGGVSRVGGGVGVLGGVSTLLLSRVACSSSSISSMVSGVYKACGLLGLVKILGSSTTGGGNAVECCGGGMTSNGMSFGLYFKSLSLILG